MCAFLSRSPRRNASVSLAHVACSIGLLCLLGGGAAVSRADLYDGIEFPGGISSFADEMVEYVVGSPAPTDPDVIDPQQAVGPPDYVPAGPGSVSLGRGGSITLRFVDNALRGSGDASPDLWVFERGGDIEDTFVDISVDGTNWIAVGKTTGSVQGVDIDAFGYGPSDLFYYVRLTDDPDEGDSSGPTVGADIDAVGAVSSTYTYHYGRGEGIVFSYKENQSDRYDLWTIRPDGTGLARLTSTPLVNEYEPQFSPDGKWIAHKEDGYSSSAKNGLYLISSEGTSLTRLATISDFSPLTPEINGPVRRVAQPQ